MNMRKLEFLLSGFSGFTHSEVDQRFRPLRDLDLVPHGPRGPFAPKVEPVHAALAVLTLVSRRASETEATIRRLLELRAVPRAEGGIDGATDELVPMVMLALSPAASEAVERIEILCDGSMAWVDFRLNGKRQRILYAEPQVAEWVSQFPDTYDAQGATHCGHRFVMTGALGAQIGLEVADEQPADYAGRPLQVA